jgi:hypothetical protein
MHTEIIEMIRLGQVQPLTIESLPKAAAEQEKLNQRFARAMHSPYVGGRRLPHAITASARNNDRTFRHKSIKVDRARAVELLLEADDLGRRK